MANVTLNKQTGNLEIIYQRKPAEATRATLRAAGFKWHDPTQRWWGTATNERVAIAMRVDPDFRPVATRRGKSMKGAVTGKCAVPKAAKANGGKALKCASCRGATTPGRQANFVLKEVAGRGAPDVCSLSCASAWLAKRDRQPLGRHVGSQSHGGGYMMPELEAARDRLYGGAKPNGAKRAASTLPPLAEWNVYAGGTGAAEGRKGYDYLPPGMHPHQKVSIQPESDSMGRHKGYTVRSYNWKYPGHEQITPAGVIRVNNGYSGDVVVRSAQEGLKAARAAWASLGHGVKANDMAADFARKVPMLPKQKAPAAHAAPKVPVIWSKVQVGDEVEFHPVPQGKLAGGLPMRGWVREIAPHARGPLVKLSHVKVLSSNDGGWINGHHSLSAKVLYPSLGAIAVLMPGTIAFEMAPGEVHDPKANGRASAKRNGNLEEELRDRRAAAKRSAKAPAGRAGKPTTPAKKKPAAKAPAKKPAARPDDAPALYSVTGEPKSYAFMSAVKIARNTVQSVGDRAAGFHGGKLQVRNLKTNKVVARWEVGPSGRFRQVKRAKK